MTSPPYILFTTVYLFFEGTLYYNIDCPRNKKYYIRFEMGLPCHIQFCVTLIKYDVREQFQLNLSW